MKHSLRQKSLLGQETSSLARRLIINSSSDSNMNALDPSIPSGLYSIFLNKALELNEESPKIHTIQRKEDLLFKAHD
jgi:hypothetical protein